MLFSGRVVERLSGGIGPRQEFIDTAVGMTIDDLGDHVGEVGARIDAVELAGFNRRRDDCAMFASAV